MKNKFSSLDRHSKMKKNGVFLFVICFAISRDIPYFTARYRDPLIVLLMCEPLVFRIITRFTQQEGQ